MKKGVTTALCICAVTMFAAAGVASEKKGEAIFKEKCAVCHPDGGNIMKADKSLKKADLAKNKIKSEADLVKYLRNPGPGMTKFDAKTLPDKDAKEVAEYILKTFK